MVSRMSRHTFKAWFIRLSVVFLIGVFQAVAGRSLSINSVAPDILFVLALSFACTEDKLINTLYVALFCGLMSDFACHSSFFGYTAIYSYSAFAMFYLKNMLLKTNLFYVITLAIVIFTLGKTALFPVLYFARSVSFGDFFLNYVLPGAAYNTAWFLMIYLIMRKISKKRGRRRAAEV